jgi:hypothetical protein
MPQLKLNLKNPGALKDEHYDWLMAEFETFTRHKGLERAILKVSRHIGKRQLRSSRRHDQEGCADWLAKRHGHRLLA